MARITVEDCLTRIPNRFDLVLVASKRARQLAKGKEATLSWDNDKPTVMALREIAEGNVDSSILKEVSAREEAETAMDQGDYRQRLEQELQQELQQEFRHEVQTPPQRDEQEQED